MIGCNKLQYGGNETFKIFGSFEETTCGAALPSGNNFHVGHPFMGKVLTEILIISTTEFFHFKASTPSSESPKQ
jgi:hypothetical protein